MADDDDRRDDEWGNFVARRTFLLTVILGALYAGSVFFFILRY